MKADILSFTRGQGLSQAAACEEDRGRAAPTLCRLPRLSECGCLQGKEAGSGPGGRPLYHFSLLITGPEPACPRARSAVTHLDKCLQSCRCLSSAQACIARLYGYQEPYDCQPFTLRNVASPRSTARPWRSACPVVLQPDGPRVTQNLPSQQAAEVASEEAQLMFPGNPLQTGHRGGPPKHASTALPVCRSSQPPSCHLELANHLVTGLAPNS